MTCILPGGLGQMAAGGTSGWSPTRNTGSVTLSNGNKTITGTGTKVCPCAGVRSRNGPKFYFEVTFGTIDPYGDFGVGVGSSAWVPTDGASIGSTVGSAGISAANNWTPAVDPGMGGPPGFTGPPAANGDIIGVAVDWTYSSASTGLWFRRGANWFNAGSPTPTFPSVPDITLSARQALAPIGSAGMSTATINTGGSAFANAPPTGFVAWG